MSKYKITGIIYIQRQTNRQTEAERQRQTDRHRQTDRGYLFISLALSPKRTRRRQTERHTERQIIIIIITTDYLWRPIS